MAGIGSGWFERRSTKMRTDEYAAIDVRRMARESWLGDYVLLAGEALVHLEWRPCHFGGYRPYFQCPRCEGRCCIVYKIGSDSKSSSYGCQKCLGMVHSVENEGKLERAMRRSDKAFNRQRYDPNRPEGKPLWMRWNTWRRLSEEVVATVMARIKHHDDLVMLIRQLDEKQAERKTILTERMKTRATRNATPVPESPAPTSKTLRAQSDDKIAELPLFGNHANGPETAGSNWSA